MDKRGVVIVGGANSTMGQAVEFFGGGYEIWGLNNIYHKLPSMLENATRWFQIHHDVDIVLTRRDMWETYDKYDFPVYTNKEGLCKNAVVYPIKEIVVEFGIYFTNTISYMIALAIKEKFDEIHMYGVDMQIASEFGGQRPSVEYFIGLARGMGINVLIPEGSDLLKTGRLYGFEGKNPIGGKVRNDLEHIEQDKRKINTYIKKARDERMKLTGALNNDLDTPEKIEWAKKRIPELVEEEYKHIDSLTYLRGMKDALEHFNANWGFRI